MIIEDNAGLIFAQSFAILPWQHHRQDEHEWIRSMHLTFSGFESKYSDSNKRLKIVNLL